MGKLFLHQSVQIKQLFSEHKKNKGFVQGTMSTFLYLLGKYCIKISNDNTIAEKK